ncbi:ABC transporter permease [Brucella gallinifaecis]|uniref:ABC transporter permease n=2 Tax=Brucella gallinifaecis TaxID=215590 RepID=A0A502BM22_9HYPH|nr:ABC transporter permease [Brucella gallinifaecis]
MHCNPVKGSGMATIFSRERFGSYVLIAPLLVFMIAVFLVPLGMVMWRSFSDTELITALPETAAVLDQWDGINLPPEAAFDTLADEIKNVAPARLASLSRRLSYENPSARELLTGTKRKIGDAAPGSGRERLAATDKRWEEPSTWQVMKRASGPVNSYHILSALDLKRDYGNGIVQARPEGGIYRDVMMRTFSIAAITTIVCIILAFPLCAFLAGRSDRTRNFLLIIVLLPFWTSILVRTTAWIVLLQDRGVINLVLQNLGIIDQPLGLLFTRTGVIIAMVHVMLPFLIFPLLGSMRAVDPRLMRAAASLGARPLYAFFRVYLPQVVPGLMAGAMLVFIITIGFYITPALLGGPGDQMVGYYISMFTTATLNWGLASSLGLFLLIITAVLFTLQRRFSRGGINLG